MRRRVASAARRPSMACSKLAITQHPGLRKIKVHKPHWSYDNTKHEGHLMALKDILLQLRSFPVPTERRTIENVVGLAETLKAHVSAIAFEMDIQLPVGLYVDPLHVGGVLAADSKKSAANASDLLDAFETIASQHAIRHDGSRFRTRPFDIPRLLADEANLHDASVLPIRDADEADQDNAEYLIFESGRPVLVLPDDPSRELPRSLDNIAVAWDFSRPATRAVGDALPLLQQADHVRIFTVVDEKAIKKSSSGTTLVQHLARHGIEAVTEDVQSRGRSIAETFRGYVADHKIDLLVMGGYGHSRLREFILGGATMGILSNPPTWVLISH
jgi:nucleotide-binding universal stress UspA family protein